jgi:adenylate cyclase, class 2
MSEDYREVEVKLYVSDFAPVETQLNAAGAALSVPRVYERNVRYDNAVGSLAPNGIVLRLRQDNAARLTYKSPPDPHTVKRGVQSRFEAEVTVSDFATMDVILTRLGFHPMMIYEKYRTTYTLNGAEIVLDEMPYGRFVEIEGKSEAIVTALLDTLHLGDAPRLSYSYTELFDHVRENLRLPFTDLTFANFEGVDVPFDAFALPRRA